jgi:Leucine-rich repeat (LRR) protein
MARLRSLVLLALACGVSLPLAAQSNPNDRVGVNARNSGIQITNNRATIAAAAPQDSLVLLNAQQLEAQPWFYDISTAMVDPSKVYKLSLDGEKLKSFPLEVLMFPNLQVLVLSHNRIDSLPQEIGTLKKLQVLNLMANRLVKLPNEIENLQNLQTLLLSRNRLSKFPFTMRSMQKLRYVDVTYNDFMLFELDWLKATLPQVEVKHESLQR